MIPEQYLDHSKKVSYDYFLDGEGTLRGEWIAKYAEIDRDTNPSPGELARILGKVINEELPNKIVTTMGRDDLTNGKVEEATSWLGSNVHQGWMIWMTEGKLAFLFERTTDAINFKMAYG